MPLFPPLLLVAYANTSRRFFSDKEAWSICHCPLPYCWSRTHDRTYNNMYTWVRMVRDCGVHCSKYTVGHIHVVKAGLSTFNKSENIGTLPYSSGFTVRAGYMLKIMIIIHAIQQCVALVRSPILSALPYDKDLRRPNGWIRPYAPPFSLHYRTHRLHADQICTNMGTSPNSSSFCNT